MIDLRWRQTRSGALMAYVPELTPECEQGCPHDFHPEVALVPQHDGLLKRREWSTTLWQVWMKRLNTYDVTVLGHDLGLQQAMGLAGHAAIRMQNAAQPHRWDSSTTGVINAVLDGVHNENPDAGRVLEHECDGEYRIDIAPDREHPGRWHSMRACDRCLYAKSPFAAYLVAEEGHEAATIRRTEPEMEEPKAEELDYARGQIQPELHPVMEKPKE